MTRHSVQKFLEMTLDGMLGVQGVRKSSANWVKTVRIEGIEPRHLLSVSSSMNNSALHGFGPGVTYNHYRQDMNIGCHRPLSHYVRDRMRLLRNIETISYSNGRKSTRAVLRVNSPPSQRMPNIVTTAATMPTKSLYDNFMWANREIIWKTTEDQTSLVWDLVHFYDAVKRVIDQSARTKPLALKIQTSYHGALFNAPTN
jgi:hypothetical protein